MSPSQLRRLQRGSANKSSYRSDEDAKERIQVLLEQLGTVLDVTRTCDTLEVAIEKYRVHDIQGTCDDFLESIRRKAGVNHRPARSHVWNVHARPFVFELERNVQDNGASTPLLGVNIFASFRLAKAAMKADAVSFEMPTTEDPCWQLTEDDIDKVPYYPIVSWDRDDEVIKALSEKTDDTKLFDEIQLCQHKAKI